MASTPLNIQVTLTLHELNQVLDSLKELRRQSDYVVSDRTMTDDEGRIRSWQVTDAEQALTKRAALSDLIHKLSGEVITEDPEVLVRVRGFRVALDAQIAADEAAKATEKV